MQRNPEIYTSLILKQKEKLKNQPAPNQLYFKPVCEVV